MGGLALSAIQKVINPTDEQCRQEEAMEFLQLMLSSKMKQFENDLKHPPEDSHRVPMGTIIETRTESYIDVEKGLDQGISNVLDAVFDGDRRNIVVGMKSIIKTAVNTFIGAASTGEKFKQEYFVYFENNAVIRFDCVLYSYKFKSYGVVGTARSCFAYMMYKSVVDHTKVPIDTMVYLVTSFFEKNRASIPDAAERKRQMFDFIDELRQVYAIFDRPLTDPRPPADPRAVTDRQAPTDQRAITAPNT